MRKFVAIMGMILFLGPILPAAGDAPPPQTGLYCAPIDTVLKDIIGTRKIGYFADAIGADGLVHMWFVRSKGREWVQITVREDLTACLIAEGIAWGFALEPAQTQTPQMDYIEKHSLLPKPAQE